MKIPAVLACCLLVLGGACSSQGTQERADMQCFTGQPVFKGNAPFQQLHLRTTTKLYALTFQTASAADFQSKLAARQNISTQVCGHIQTATPPMPDTLLVLQINIPAHQ